MAAGHGDALVARDDAGTDLPSRIDRIAHAGVEVAQAADRADGRGAAHELDLCVLPHQPVGDRGRDGIGEEPLDQGRVVALLLLRLAVAREVHMHVDEAGQQVAAAEVDDLAAGDAIEALHDIRDLSVLDDHGTAGLGLHMLRAVEDDAVHVGVAGHMCSFMRNRD